MIWLRPRCPALCTCPGVGVGDSAEHLHSPGHLSEMHPWQQDPEPLEDADSHSYPLLNSSGSDTFGTLE